MQYFTSFKMKFFEFFESKILIQHPHKVSGYFLYYQLYPSKFTLAKFLGKKIALQISVLKRNFIYLGERISKFETKLGNSI